MTGKSFPFVGRDREISAAIGSLRGGGAVVFGPAGIGKSRLIAEAVRHCRRVGYAPVAVYGTRAAAEVPLGAFASVLPHDVLGDQSGQALQLAAEALRRVAGPRRLVVAVDDAPLLDETSAAVVENIVLHGQGGVLLGVRESEPSGHLENLLWRDELSRIDLAPLAEADVLELMRRRLDGPVDPAAAAFVLSVTGGNPLFVREVLRSGLAAGSLRHDSGRWRWCGPLTVTPGLAEIVAARIGELSSSDRDVLEVLAYGEPVGMSMLSKIAPGGDLESLEERGLIAVAANRRRIEVRLGHPLYGEQIRTRASRIRVDRHRRALADAVQAAGARRSGDVLRVAVWLLDGNADAPAELLAEAANHAYRAFDPALAYRIGRHALTTGGGATAVAVVANSLGFNLRTDSAEELFASIWPSHRGSRIGTAIRRDHRP
ncbi:AAA family ATPase [Fodinicola acaciae]|uniref:AAA family ATPase n=1 Tax=Fodinicola acaciae TaxID=2681555 RepID=UPI0013D52A9B|nr:AAA family ATPase [Fodinicola acaciae]